MIRIVINGILVTELKPIKKVRSISISGGGIHVLTPRHKAQELIDYVFKAVQQCKGIIIFNGVIVEKKSVKYVDLGV